LELARKIDAVVLVARLNQTTIDDGVELRSLAERLDIKFVGVIVTGAPLVGVRRAYGGHPSRSAREGSLNVLLARVPRWRARPKV
jgi:hypothetical protein